MNKAHRLDSRRQAAGANGGFTLIELLVVIAIISLLLTLLLPGLHRARVAARRTVCQVSLKGLSQAKYHYLHDSRGWFLKMPNVANAHTSYGGWVGREGLDFLNLMESSFGDNIPASELQYIRRPLNYYCDLPQILRSSDNVGPFRCAADRPLDIDSEEDSYLEYGTSFFTNPFIVGSYQIGDLWDPALQGAVNRRLAQGVHVDQLAQPARQLLMGDMGWMSSWDPRLRIEADWHDKPCFHNMAFADGHVEYLHIGAIEFFNSHYRLMPFRSLDRQFAELMDDRQDFLVNYPDACPHQ